MMKSKQRERKREKKKQYITCQIVDRHANRKMGLADYIYWRIKIKNENEDVLSFKLAQR